MGIRKRLSLGHPGLDELSIERHQAFRSSQLRHTSVPCYSTVPYTFSLTVPSPWEMTLIPSCWRFPVHFRASLNRRGSTSTGRGDEKRRRRTQLSPLLVPAAERGLSQAAELQTQEGSLFWARVYIVHLDLLILASRNSEQAARILKTAWET